MVCCWVDSAFGIHEGHESSPFHLRGRIDERLHDTDKRERTSLSYQLVGSILSSEFYLRTVPFLADREASTLKVELIRTSGEVIGCFSVNVENMPFSTPFHVADALSIEIKGGVDDLYNAVTDTKTSLPKKKPTLKVSYKVSENDGSRFWLSLNGTAKQGFHARLGNNDPTSILPMLGFTGTRDILPGNPAKGKEDWRIGNGGEHGGRSLQDQRIRSDPLFGSLRDEFQKKFGGTRIRRRQGVGGIPMHDGHLLVTEYLFSLVFLSMYREKGATMKIQNAAELAGDVNLKSVEEFNEKMRLVSDFNVGAADVDNPYSLRIVMDFIKQASCQQT